MGCPRHFAALMRKQYLQRVSSLANTVLEFALPLAFVLGMLLLSLLFKTTSFPASSHEADVTIVAPLFSVPAALYRAGSGGIIAVSSSSPSGAVAAAAFSAHAAALYPPMPIATLGGGALAEADLTGQLQQLTLPGWSDVAVPFASSSDLDAYIAAGDYGTASKPPIFAAIVFNAGLPQLDYALRFNASVVPQTSGFLVNTYSAAYNNGWISRGYSKAPAPGAVGLNVSRLAPFPPSEQQQFAPGFLTLQLAVDRWAINSSVSTSDLNESKLIQLFLEGMVNVLPYDLLKALPVHLTQLSPANRTRLANDLRAGALRSESFAPQQLSLVPFPSDAYSRNVFYQLVLGQLTLLFVIAFIFPVSRLVSGIVSEKETKMREAMRIMGLSDAALSGSWWCTYAIIFTVLAFAISMIGLKLFPNSSPVIIFFLFWSFALSSISLAMLIAVFFTQSKVASVIGSAAYVASYFAKFALSTTSSSGVKAFASLLSPTALGCGMDVLATLETSGVGATSTTAFTAVVNEWTVGSTIGMQFFDTALYLVLAWYIDQILPASLRDYGSPRPFYFPFTLSFYQETCGCEGAKRASRKPTTQKPKAPTQSFSSALFTLLRGGSGEAGGANESLLSNSSATPENPSLFEAPDSSLQAKAAAGKVVSVRDLRKEFDTPDGIKVAVAGFDVDMYEGQIFVLLGHNGAGKTTAISMLTGLIPPTSGTASIYGRGLEDLAAIRRDLGICPQHDVLWAELTVMEHLRLFSAIKGVAVSSVDEEAHKSLALVGLTEKADVRVSALSGGQKRKLSVCLAFLGGSRVIFLDEPTSGMDPYSRRSTWQILQNAREGRIIVLTTHFMDEADILGDRIAIMAEGRVKCSGSPMFLKEAFGIGYSMVIERGNSSIGDASLMALVRSHVPSASVTSAAGAELTIRLPMDAAGMFGPLLRDLEGPRGIKEGVRGVGIGVTSVEDVFLRVAAGEGHEAAESSTAAAATAAAAATTPLTDAKNASYGTLTGSTTLTDIRKQARAEMSAIDAFTTHYSAIFLKRSRYARRDLRAVCCMLLIPIVALCGGLFALLSSSWGTIPPMQLSSSVFNNAGQRGVGGVPQFPNFVPMFAFKAGSAEASGPPMNADVVALIAAFQTANVSTDGNALVLSRDAVQQLEAANASGFITSSEFPLRNWQRMSTFLVSSAHKYAASKYGAFSFEANGTVVDGQSEASALGPVGSGKASLATTVYYNSSAVHGPAIFMNLLSTAALRVASAWSPSTGETASTPRVSTFNYPLPLTPYEAANVLAAQSFAVTQVVMLALAFVTPAFIQFVVREREVSAKHQQLISGVSIPAYWVGNLAFDFVSYCIPAALVVICLKAFNAGPLVSTSTDNVGAVIVLLLSYGLSGATSTYALSHVFTSPAGAGAAAVMINILLFAGVLAMFILEGIDTTCRAVPPTRAVLNLLPFFAFGSGLSNIASIATLPQNALLCDAAHGGIKTDPNAYAPYTSSFAIGVAGTSIAYLLVTSFFFLALAIGVDYSRNDMALRLWLSSACGGGRKKQAAEAAALRSYADSDVDADVAVEAARAEAQVAGLTPHKEVDDVGGGLLSTAELGTGREGDDAVVDAVLISHMRKTFAADGGGGCNPLATCGGGVRRAATKVAVHDLSFGIPAGEVFGFLGINGAGKTTTLKMLSGDECPSSGRALLGGYDIVGEQAKVRRLLGYCPQFDALLDLLTAREHLELYARIKGVSSRDLKAVVDAKLSEFDLVPFANKLAGRLSGGNKRKLSVAIALIGDPPIVFLDEPSTGVDPIAKRFMWRVISRVATERRQCAVILTTHSMEEVAALCTRIGIMVGGRLRCLGSAQHLRSTHGAGYSVEMRLTAPSEAEKAAVISSLSAAGLLVPGTSGGDGALALPAASLQRAATVLGAPARAALVAATASGWPIAAAFEATAVEGGGGIVPAALFATWWGEESRVAAALAALAARPAFASARLLERQGYLLKLRVPIKEGSGKEGRSLAMMFEELELVRRELGAGTMTLGETRLEEIFNQMAAQQLEETGVARGTVTVTDGGIQFAASEARSY